MSTQIKKVRVPTGSLAATAFPRIDYADAYAIRLPGNVPHNGPHDVEALGRAFLTAAPSWVEWLLALRDRFVGIIGLKTASHAPRPQPAKLSLKPGTQAGIFKIYARTTSELLMGEDDRHLDFRVSLLLRESKGVRWAVVTTVVQFNGLLGRAYFLPMRPFHRLIVVAMMRNMLAALYEK